MPVTERIPTEFSYSAATTAGDLVFLGLHRGFGDTFAEQLDDAIASVCVTLEHLGLGLEHLVKVNVWLRSVDDLWEMEKRFFEYFSDGVFPARMTATTDFVDSDCLVQVEGVAHRAAAGAAA